MTNRYVQLNREIFKADAAARQVLLRLREEIDEAISIRANEATYLGAILYGIAYSSPDVFFEVVADLRREYKDGLKLWLEEAAPEGSA